MHELGSRRRSKLAETAGRDRCRRAWPDLRGTEEAEAASWLKETEQKKLPSSFRVDILQGLTHDYLNADPNSMQAIGKIFDYIDAARGPDGRGGQAVVDAAPDMDRGGP